MAADTVAKLLHEWTRTDRPPLGEYRLPAGTTVIVDEAGMVGTPSLHQLVDLAEREEWRLALVGDPRQLQAVGRGGLFNELCATGRVHELARLHRFTHPWEAAASLRLRAGDPAGSDVYEDHGRIVAGTVRRAPRPDRQGVARPSPPPGRRSRSPRRPTTTSTRSTTPIQRAPPHRRPPRPRPATPIAAGEHAYVGDLVATRRNDRQLLTTAGEPVRNRDLWTVTAIRRDGSLTVSHLGGHGTVTLPCDYVRDHVRLGYAATEHGNQADTVDVGIAARLPGDHRRGLYVGATRGRDENRIHVVTESADLAEARDVLEAVLAYDRADVPAITQRRHLAHQTDRPESSREPDQVVPAWLVGYRDQLEQRREDLTVCLTERAHRRAEAAAELADLQPAVAAARGGVAALRRPHRRHRTTSCAPCCVQRCGKPTTTPATPGSGIATARPAEPRSRAGGSATPKTASPPSTPTAATLKQHLDTLQAEARRLADLGNPASDHLRPRPTRPRRAPPARPADRRRRHLDDLGQWTTRRDVRTGRGCVPPSRRGLPRTAAGYEGR